jgi:hypothetical protein
MLSTDQAHLSRYLWQQPWIQPTSTWPVQEPNRISSSGRHGLDPFMLDQRTRSVLRAPCRTALDCNPNCNLTDPWLPADDSVTPWSSLPSPGLFLATWPCPVLSQTPPPNPIAAEPDGSRVLSRGGAADHAVTLKAPLTGSGCREHSYGGFGGGDPHFHPHTAFRKTDLCHGPLIRKSMQRVQPVRQNP